MPPDDYTRTSDKKRFHNSDPADKNAKPKQSSKRYAVWLLSRREYSAAELRTKMIMRGYTAEEADEAMAFVTEHQFQSDERYAGMKARSTAHRAGNRRIAMVLKQKGIEEEIATSQIASLAPEDERAIEAASKFRRQIAEAGMTQELSQKIWRFLSYRGFSSQAIKAAMAALSRPD